MSHTDRLHVVVLLALGVQLCDLADEPLVVGCAEPHGNCVTDLQVERHNSRIARHPSSSCVRGPPPHLRTEAPLPQRVS